MEILDLMMRLNPVKSLTGKLPIFLPFILFIFGIIGFSSCSVTKPSYYFKTLQKDTTLSNVVNKDLELKIRKSDILAIQVTSLSKEEDALLNSAAAAGTTSAGYTVDSSGNILFHRLGLIHVEGMTRRELKDKLLKDLAPYLKDAVVNVTFVNHKITVLGEVNAPKIITLEEDQMTVLDALVSAGDIIKNSKRDNVLIIRDKQDGTKKVKHINLENHSIFSSPWYYLQANDIVYVPPDEKLIKKLQRKADFQQNLSLVLTGISLVLLVVDRILHK